MISLEDQRAALTLARETIAEALGGPPAHSPTGAVFRAPQPNFVTLFEGDRLQGCIGDMAPSEPLAASVRRNALAAAFEDPRGRTLQLRDVPGLTVELSLLSPREPIAFSSEEEALAALRPHVDGVLLTWRHRRGVFLPQVWKSLPEPSSFLDQLKRKAGLPEDFWADDVSLERFTVTEFHDGPSTR